MKFHRDFIDAFHLNGADNRIFLDIAEKGYLVFQIIGQPLFAPAQEDLRLNPYLPQFLNGMLRRLCL